MWQTSVTNGGPPVDVSIVCVFTAPSGDASEQREPHIKDGVPTRHRTTNALPAIHDRPCATRNRGRTMKASTRRTHW